MIGNALEAERGYAKLRKKEGGPLAQEEALGGACDKQSLCEDPPASGPGRTIRRGRGKGCTWSSPDNTVWPVLRLVPYGPYGVASIGKAKGRLAVCDWRITQLWNQ